jgi:bifunctional UDP-N-acetylglucosamine pyrophosphorylase / glucosamine-1-phosphate N-acetyltransferase
MTQMRDANYINSFFSLAGYEHASLFAHCTYPWEALHFIKEYLEGRMLGNIETEVPPSSFLLNPHLISIGKGTHIDPGVYIAGPCIIGENCEIRHGAYLRGNVILGHHCVIGHATEVKHSIFLNRASAPHFNYVGDSILGNEVNLGAGMVCANYRLDHENIAVFFEGKKIKTTLKKLGAIIGDGAQLGCNSVANPGTLIGKGARCCPCSTISGHVPEGSFIKAKGI